jgi:hypothetical protein
MKHVFLLTVLALALASCADQSNAYRAGYQAYHDQVVYMWGPESSWTQAQHNLYARGLLQLSQKYQGDINQRYASLASRPNISEQPVFNPCMPSGGVQSYGAYSAQGTPSTAPIGAFHVNRYDPNSLANPYGAGSPYKPDGLMNPYGQYGSAYSNKSWRNPYATDAPKLYDSGGNYRGRFSTNPYAPDSTSNPYGRYGSKYSPDSINNPYGAGNPYSPQPIYVAPSR